MINKNVMMTTISLDHASLDPNRMQPRVDIVDDEKKQISEMLQVAKQVTTATLDHLRDSAKTCMWLKLQGKNV